MTTDSHNDGLTITSLISERQRVLEEWNATAAPYPGDRCIHELVAAQAARTPEAVAVVFGDTTLTYRELERRAERVALMLRRLGVGPDVRVCIAMERSLELLAGLLGILKAGGAYVPIDPNYPAERIAYMLEDAQAAVLVTQPELRDRLPAHTAQVLMLTEAAINAAEDPALPIATGAMPDNLAYIIYTSGSTGKPKGVQITHQGMVNFLWAMRQQPGLDQNDVVLAVTTLSFDIAGLELLLPLITGARVALASREHAVDASRLKALIAAMGATLLQATPATWRLLLQAGWEGGPELRILCGGEALPPSLASQLLSRCGALWNVYGPTETTVWSMVSRVEAPDRINIGRPVANMQAYVLDESLQPVPVGAMGELYIGGDGLGRGYRNRPDLTARQFIPHPFSQKPGARLYKTGDLARYQADGTLLYLGRNDHQVKVRGFRIELGEIETALSNHPQVQHAVVVAREDQSGELGLVAYVVEEQRTKSQEPIEKQNDEPEGSKFLVLGSTELRNYLKALLPEYMIPSVFVFLESMPLSPNGKVDRSALPLPGSIHSEPEEPYVAPVTAAELVVTGIWAQVLDVERVGVRDNFFNLGGHSLLATQVIVQLQAIFQVEITQTNFFKDPTPAGLMAELARLWQSADVVEEIARIVRELESLSADEIDRLLSA